MSEAPYTFAEARRKQLVLNRQQEEAEQATRDAYRRYAEAERAYRRALARKIVELRASSWPATLVADLARGDEHVAQLRYERDLAEGMVEAAKQAGWRHQANRRDGHEFLRWSASRDLAEGGVVQHFEDVSPRRAA